MPSNIEMNNWVNDRVPRAACPPVLGLVVSTVLLSGCQLMVNPFRDELAGRQEMTTASVEGARAAKTTPTVRQRDYAPFELHAEGDGVTHGPLYFEDPFEDKGSEDGRFAWTGEDYLQFVYWRGRFLLNTLFFPVSAVVTPPWTVMESDGRVSREALGWDHDAERWVEPPVDEPTDSVSAGG
jgi:hypothetical protein